VASNQKVFTIASSGAVQTNMSMEDKDETSETATVEWKQLRGHKLRISDGTTVETLLPGKEEIVEGKKEKTTEKMGKKKTKKSKVSVSAKVGL
jgi:hypothetical protein